VDDILDSKSPYVQSAIPYFATLGRETRTFGNYFAASWTKRALGNGAWDRVFAVVLGYAVFAFLIAIYLNVLTVGSMRSAGRAVRQTVRHQLMVAKVRSIHRYSYTTRPDGPIL
jgi:E3 ubiquitin-protein ligase MARCH6